MFSRKERIMIPTCPHSCCVVDVDFLVSSHWPDNAIQLRNFFFLTLTKCLLLPDHEEDTLQSNSFTIPRPHDFFEALAPPHDILEIP